MSDILIKNMKMPKKCICCPLSHWNKLDELTGCELHQKHIPNAEKEFWEKDRPDWCPLIELPPHGDLIDRDTLLVSENQHYEIHSDSFYVEVRTIELAPTIIEAEG